MIATNEINGVARRVDRNNGNGRPVWTSSWRRCLKRYPHIRQHDETDCGAACLAMITSYYGSPVAVSRLRDMANVDANGASLWSLAQAAEALGFHARALQLEFQHLRQLSLPAVVHWKGSHYIVVYSATRRHVVVADPGLERKRMSKEEFMAGWTGRVLELIPSAHLASVGAHTSSWKRFLPTVTPFKWMVGEVLVASFILSVLGLGIPMFTQMVIDRVLVHRSLDLLNMLLIGMAVVTVFQALIASVRRLILVHISLRWDARLISDFFRQVFRLPMRYFDLRRVGDIVSRVSENRKIRAAMSGTIPGVFLDTVLAIGYLALLASYNLKMTCVVLAVIPLFVVLMLIFTPILRRNQKEQFDKRTEASTFVIESMTGISTIKTMAVESQSRWKLETLFVESMLMGRRGAHWATLYSGLGTVVKSLSTVLFIWYGARQVMVGAMTAGQLIAFFTIAGNVITPILGLINSCQSLQEVRNAIERLNDVFEAEPEQQNGRTLICPSKIDGHICLENISYSYTNDEDDLALCGIDLDIRPGETVAVVGRSGSGKSTLMKIVQGLYSPTRGRVLVDGHDLRNVSHSSLRRRMGVLPQEVVLFSGTVRDNIALSDPDMSFKRVVEAATLAGAHDFICQFGMGYDTTVGERGLALSGGQRQRIALARALHHNPDMLLLDEPTSSLDGEAEQTIQENIEHAFPNTTILINAHRLSTVRRADRIIVMEQGRIVEQGTHEQLAGSGGLYTRLVGQQLNQ